MISAMAVESGLVLSQQRSEGKKNEIKTVQSLLDSLALHNACVTLDAMHCQKDTVKKIRAQSADYVIQVKSNQGRLYQEIQAFFHKMQRDEADIVASRTFEDVDKGHGRLEQRCYCPLNVTSWLESAKDWQDLKQVIQVTRHVTKGAAVTQEQAYYITSMSDNGQVIAEKIRRHWHIENVQHWVLDVTYKEDDSRIRVGDAPQNMALFRRFMFNLAALSPIKESKKGKLKRAAWDDEFRAKLLFG